MLRSKLLGKFNFLNKKIVATNAFTPCSREVCFCFELISRPKQTKITKKLLINADNCRKEYYSMKDFYRKN